MTRSRRQATTASSSHAPSLRALPGLTCRASEKSRLLTPDLVASRMGKAEHAWAFDFGFHRGRINRPPAHVTLSPCSPAYGGHARALGIGFHRGRINRPPANVSLAACSPAYG